MSSALDELKAACDELAAADDNLLLAIAAIAAHGRIQILPHRALFGGQSKPIIVLPERMYDRMLTIVNEQPKDSQ